MEIFHERSARLSVTRSENEAGGTVLDLLERLGGILRIIFNSNAKIAQGNRNNRTETKYIGLETFTGLYDYTRIKWTFSSVCSFPQLATL